MCVQGGTLFQVHLAINPTTLNSDFTRQIPVSKLVIEEWLNYTSGVCLQPCPEHLAESKHCIHIACICKEALQQKQRFNIFLKSDIVRKDQNWHNPSI